MAEAFSRYVDAISEWAGRIFGWMFEVLMLSVVADVFTRYVLNKPWYYMDFNIQFMGALALMGGAYTLLHRGHVGVDICVTRLSQKGKAILNVILFPLTVISVGALLWKTGEGAMDSLRIMEHYTSAFAPPIYPYKTMMAVGVALLLLQGGQIRV